MMWVKWNIKACTTSTCEVLLLTVHKINIACHIGHSQPIANTAAGTIGDEATQSFTDNTLVDKIHNKTYTLFIISI